jgi:hypothetical protein
MTRPLMREIKKINSEVVCTMQYRRASSPCSRSCRNRRDHTVENIGDEDENQYGWSGDISQHASSTKSCSGQESMINAWTYGPNTYRLS